MSYRIGFAVLAALALANAGTTTEAQAQNKGQIVQAVAKLNAAQLAVVKRLADDPTFAQQFEAATSSGDYATAANLVSSATGVDKGSIRVAPRGLAMGPARVEERPSMVSYASLEHRTTTRRTMALSGKICFDFSWVQGCISF